MLRTRLTNAEAEAEAEREALVGVVDGNELWELGGLGSRGSELSLRPDEEGTSIGRQDAEEGGEEAPRLVAEDGLDWLQGTRGGGELPVEGTDTELRSSRSVTDTDSSPGLENRGRGSESDTQRKSHCERKCLLENIQTEVGARLNALPWLLTLNTTIHKLNGKNTTTQSTPVS